MFHNGKSTVFRFPISVAAAATAIHNERTVFVGRQQLREDFHTGHV